MRKLLTFALIGLLAQMVDGAMGMAYGVTSTTALLAVGTSPVVTSASVHLAEVGTTFVSGVAHWRFRNLDWRTVITLGIPGAAGAFIGASVLTSLSAGSARPWIAALMLVLGIYIFIQFTAAWQRRAATRRRGKRFLLPLGSVAGFVDALGGGGWGPIATPTLLATAHDQPRRVVGSVSASEFMVTVAASLGFLLHLGGEAFSLGLVVALLIGGTVAAPLAAWLVHTLQERVLAVLVSGLIVLLNVRTILTQLHLDDAQRLSIYFLVVAVWCFALGQVTQLRWPGSITHWRTFRRVRSV